MEHHAPSTETLRRATQHLQLLLLRTTPGKNPQAASAEAEAIANLAFQEGNPVRELFISATPRTVQEHPRSPSPTATIRPKSSKANFFKFGRGSRDKSSSTSGSSSGPTKQTTIEGVTPLFEQCFGPIEEKKPKRKERVVDATPPTSSAGPSKGIPLASFNATQSQKTARVYEQYKCIVCDSELSSKGVCKRHLEEQHITPKVWQCERCPSFFDTKAEAKKHCSQCGDGDLSYVATKITRKVYACEFTGSCFQSLDNYLRNLLVLSEQRDPRPRPDLKKKIDALLGWVERRNAKFGPVVGEASNDLFGVPEAWKELQWDPDYLRGKIAVLEHATFNEDGTMGSSRWTGSSPKQRNTKTYITQLFQAGRLPKNYSAGTHIKPEAMSICSTPMPLSHKPPSVASGPTSADTPLRMTSPYPRSHSRQTVYSHEAMDQRTSTSTPRSNGDEVMTAELKSKRHLSDESRAYIPARTPPGPPDPPTDQYQYLSDPTMMGQPPQLPPLPAFTTPSNSSVCLPLRKVDGAEAMPPPHQSIAPTAQHYGHHHQHPLYHHLPPQHSTNTFSNSSSSDLASETSTLAQSYREPEYSSVPMDYHMWQQQQQQLLAFQQQQQQHAGYGGYGAQFDYSMPDDASIVASSVNTGNTIGVDYVTEIPKMEGFEGMDLSGGHGQVGTFYLGDEEEGRR